MNHPGHYPPPDFSCPPPNFIQPAQQPRASSFHPNMWSWSETPSEPSWGYNEQACWQGYGATQTSGQSFGRHGGANNYGSFNSHRKKQRNTKKQDPQYSSFCDTCDRGFKNQEKYDEHMSQHVKCSVPDCSFTAHEKIVKIHMKNSHAPGIESIKLDTPEAIAKWREERRKNYPTLQNVEKKRKVMEVREETGGVLETAQFGRMKGRGRGRGHGHGRGRGWGSRGFQDRHPRGPHPFHGSTPERPPPVSQPCREGDPLGVLVSNDCDSDREDAPAESRTGGLVVPPKQMSSALGSLVANYGSSSENESDEEPETTPIQKAKDLLQENQVLLNTTPLDSQGRGFHRGMETSCSSRGTETNKAADPVPAVCQWKRGRGGRRGKGGRHQDTLQKRGPTLLEMLLAQDIRHERNVLLQCVRHVVCNNFFGLERRPQPQNETIKALSQSAQNGTATPEDGKQEDIETNKVVAVDHYMPQNNQDHNLRRLCRDHVCSALPDDPPVASAGSSDAIQQAAEPTANGCHSVDLKATDRITPTSNMYDDEIWESPGSVL